MIRCFVERLLDIDLARADECTTMPGLVFEDELGDVVKHVDGAPNRIPTIRPNTEIAIAAVIQTVNRKKNKENH